MKVLHHIPLPEGWCAKKKMRIINLLKKNSRTFGRLFWGGMLILFFIAMPSSAYAAIPKSGNIAIAVDAMPRSDTTPHQVASAEAMIVQWLIARGYKPVDENKLAQIRRERALFFAAVDDVAAIRRLSSQYGVSTIITVHLNVYQQKDPLVGYDGRSSLVVMATSSDGNRLYAGSIDARKPGHTPEQAVRSAMESVIQQAIDEMTR